MNDKDKCESFENNCPVVINNTKKFYTKGLCAYALKQLYYRLFDSWFIAIALQNAFNKLKILDEHLDLVKAKAADLAEYFCDEREEFLMKVFEEMWKFVHAFIECTKVCPHGPSANQE